MSSLLSPSSLGALKIVSLSTPSSLQITSSFALALKTSISMSREPIIMPFLPRLLLLYRNTVHPFEDRPGKPAYGYLQPSLEITTIGGVHH